MYHKALPIGGIAAGAGGAALGAGVNVMWLISGSVTLVVASISVFSLLPKIRRNAR